MAGMRLQKERMGTIAKTAVRFGGVALSVLGLSLVLGASALAAAPDHVLRMPQSEELPEPGGGATQTNNVRGVAGNPATGHVYVAELENHRIGEYTAWGSFVRAWGWDVAPEGAPGDTAADELEICGPASPEAEPPAGLCKAGTPGPGKGQLDEPMGLALDPSGNVYVFERGNRRVQKFSAAGGFLLMFGGDVNLTKVGEGAEPEDRNVCPVDPTDVCQAGTAGEGPSQLDITLGDFIAYSPAPTDAIVVGDKGRIQIFDLDGTYREEIAFEGDLGALAGKQVNGLDVDKDRNIYISLDAAEDLYKLSPTGEPLSPGKPGASSFEAENPLGVAVDVQGGVYAIDDPSASGVVPRVVKFSADGERLIPTDGEAGDAPFPDRTFEARLTAIATNVCAGSEAPGNLYVGFFNAGGGARVSYVDAFGTGPVGCEPPPPNPPIIGEQFAASVGREEATLRARINPKFWTDVTYYVEYGTGECAKGGCPNKMPLAPELLTDKAVNKFLLTAGVVLEGLSPLTTYHYRFVAQGPGGGPVFGVDPDGAGPLLPDEEHGLEATFTTHAVKGVHTPCANDAFRVGPGAKLPDCRAYEMVSPLDKGNADVALGFSKNNTTYWFFEVNQAALSGQRFTFSAATAFGDPEGAPFSSQYLAQRGGKGWASEPISPPRTEAGVEITRNFGAEFQGFTDDLCRGWLRLLSVAPLTADAVEKYPNLYRRDNCADPASYTALTTEKPPNREAGEYHDLSVKGFSADGDHTIFTSTGKLHPDAPSLKGERLLYEHTPEGLRFVCYLPSGKASTEACTAADAGNDVSRLHNAISADGSRIFWTAYSGGTLSNPGRIFVRIEGKETRAVSSPVSSEPASFWGAAKDGSRALFSFESGSRKGELYEFDVDAKAASMIATGVEAPMGMSEDVSRVYFASSEDLDGAGPADAGDRNLYFREADPGGGPGSVDFIMVLAGTDKVAPAIGNEASLAPVGFEPALRAARVTPDGLHATFTSAASPTPAGYDNRDAASGVAAAEVYRYDAVAAELRCVSCNPTGARPAAGGFGSEMAAGRIQGWETLNHAPRVISDDGSRIFFESHEALVPEDANGTWDVYEWEEPSRGTCTESSSSFSELTGGCVDLISSGQSPARSLFLDADPSGDNVFFGTQSGLVSSDYGLNDVYVARVGGGFPQPVPPSECEGAACQSPPPPPPTATRASEAFRGPGDRVKRRCPKGKRRVVRKGRARCVKRSRPGGRRAGSQRRGARR
jgi:DNA-binding beta-propeller fold protein YncE